MTRPIRQSVTLNASPEELYETFLDSKKHAAVTGAPTKIDRKVGGRFTAFNGQLKGRTLLVEPKRLIVQAWRSSQWKPEDPDSILVLRFSKAARGGRIDSSTSTCRRATIRASPKVGERATGGRGSRTWPRSDNTSNSSCNQARSDGLSFRHPPRPVLEAVEVVPGQEAITPAIPPVIRPAPMALASGTRRLGAESRARPV